jgi:hypothetical protein
LAVELKKDSKEEEKKDGDDDDADSFENATIENTKELDIKGHLILVGNFIDISYFVHRLRAYKLSKSQPLVILASSAPDELTWRRFRGISELYVVMGVPTDEGDLERAGVEHAKNLVILGGEDTDKSDLAVDARSIMTFRTVKALETIFPFVDLVHSSNSRFLGSLPSLGNTNDDTENAYYAAGQVFTASMLDTLIVQAFFNEYIAELIDRLTEGLIFSIPVAKALPDAKDKKYAELFKQLVDTDFVPVALYRKSDNRLRYLMTNPGQSVTIHENDYVLVMDKGSLAQKIDTRGVSALRLFKAKGSSDAVKRRRGMNSASIDGETSQTIQKLKDIAAVQQAADEGEKKAQKLEEKLKESKEEKKEDTEKKEKRKKTKEKQDIELEVKKSD